MPLVVTGARGYVGGAVVAAAVRRGDLSTTALVRRPAPWLHCDVLRTQDFADGLARSTAGAAAVVHLAGPDQAAVTRSPEAGIAETVEAGRLVAEACEAAGVRRLVYLSTVHVHGDAVAGGEELTESRVPIPSSPYGVSRLACERTITEACQNTEVVVLRLSNAVGAPAADAIDCWTLVANDLCRQAVETGQLRLLSAGGQSRDFIALRDVADLVLNAASGSVLDPGLYHVGSGTATTIRGLAELVRERAERVGISVSGIVAPVDSGQSGPPVRFVIERLSAAGWAPQVSIEEALDETLEFCAARGPHPAAALREGATA
jgi:UDP-glucose 4-epimerase